MDAQAGWAVWAGWAGQGRESALDHALTLSCSLGNGPPGRSTLSTWPAGPASRVSRQSTLSAHPGRCRLDPPRYTIRPIPTVRSTHRTTSLIPAPQPHCQHIASRPSLPTSSSTGNSQSTILTLSLLRAYPHPHITTTTFNQVDIRLPSYLPPHRPLRPLSISNACRRPCLIPLNLHPPSSSLDQFFP